MTVTANAPIRRNILSLDRLAFFFCILTLGLTVLYPTGRLLFEAVRHWDYPALTHNPGRAAILNTLVIALGSVAGAGCFGTALAFALMRYTFPGRRWLGVLAYLPFTLPPLVGVLSFYYLIGRDGLAPRLIERVSGFENAVLPGPWAILLVHTYSFYVFFYAMVSAALESLDRSQPEAARTLGAGPLRVFFKVTLPLLRPALVGAALLTFMSAGASFSAPYFFGRDYPLLSVQIFNERSQFNNDAALTLSVILGAVGLLGIILFRSGRKPVGVAAKGVRVAIRSRSGRAVAALAAWLIILLLLLPHLTLLWLSFVDYREWHGEVIPFHLTMANYTGLFREARAFAPFRNSLWMSAAATLGAAAVSLPAAYLIARRRPGGRWIDLLVMIPWALPGTVVAMNLIAAFNDPWLPIYNTIWMLPLAYYVRSIPLLARIFGAAIEPFDVSLVEAGRTLGASRGHCFARVVLPLIAPSVAAGMALAFVTCLGEFVVSILLYLPSNVPISVQINMEWRAAVGPAFSYSVLLMALAGGTFGLSRRFCSRVI